jgi:putative nucleotidyltransferase with HDIG domain
MTNKMTKIHVYELRIGMHVLKLDIPWEESPFKLPGLEIKNQEDIKSVQSVSDYVHIDPKWQKGVHEAVPVKLAEASGKKRFSTSFVKAANAYQGTKSLIKNIMDDIRLGNQLNLQEVKKSVSECVDRILENSDAILLLTQLKDMDEYTSQHSLNVSIMSILMGKSLQLSREELNQIGECGLLHDIGKMKIPLEILNKQGRLTDKEMEIMKSHTTKGRDILLTEKHIFPGAIDVAYTHHEHLDGGGYPRGIDSERISFFTRIVAIVDAYDAITSDRVYQQGRLHLDAIKILVDCRKTHFDDSLVIKFIDCMGIYPVGNPVEMTNGEVGMVVESNPENRVKPKVLLLLDAQKKTRQEKLIDMDDPDLVDDGGNPYKLFKVINQQTYGLNLRKYFENGQLTTALATV